MNLKELNEYLAEITKLKSLESELSALFHKRTWDTILVLGC